MFIKESVSVDAASMRIDSWIHHKWPWIPYGAIQKALRKKIVRVDAGKALSNSRLLPGQEVRVLASWLSSFALPEQKKPLTDAWHRRISEWILYEDEDLIAINKPQGITCQGGSGQLIHIDMLFDHLVPNKKMRLVHRLDKDTSGVLLIAKTLSCAQGLTKAFQEKRIQKTYWAIVYGHPPAKGKITHSLERNDHKMVISKHPAALSALTSYYCKTVGFDKDLNQKVAWLELFPKTGRTHQLRVHLESIGHPILGDNLYGNEFFEHSNRGLLALHCHTLAFTYKEKEYLIKAPAPQTFFSRLSKAGITF